MAALRGGVVVVLSLNSVHSATSKKKFLRRHSCHLYIISSSQLLFVSQKSYSATSEPAQITTEISIVLRTKERILILCRPHLRNASSTSTVLRIIEHINRRVLRGYYRLHPPLTQESLPNVSLNEPNNCPSLSFTVVHRQ